MKPLEVNGQLALVVGLEHQLRQAPGLIAKLRGQIKVQRAQAEAAGFALGVGHPASEIYEPAQGNAQPGYAQGAMVFHGDAHCDTPLRGLEGGWLLSDGRTRCPGTARGSRLTPPAGYLQLLDPPGQLLDDLKGPVQLALQVDNPVRLGLRAHGSGAREGTDERTNQDHPRHTRPGARHDTSGAHRT